MRNRIAKKHIEYLVLLFASIVSLALAIYFAPNKQILSLIVISFSAFYFLWGIIHHKFEDTLHSEVVFEYLLFSILGALLIVGLI